MMQPLSGVRVVDLSWVLAGPVVGRLLASAGAEVIKIESHKRMDSTRMGRPAPFENADSEPFDRTPLFHNLNAGKKSVAVDLSTSEGTSIVKRLVRRSDVVLENFTPGVLDRLGLSYETLKGERPDIILLSMSGMGQHGPLAALPAYAPTVSSLAGLESLVGYELSEVTGMVGVNFADSVSALYGFHAVLNALWARHTHAIGQHVDYSMVEGVCTMLPAAFIDTAACLDTEADKSRGAPEGVFPVQGEDQWVALCATSQERWEALRRALDGADWARDPAYDTLAARRSSKEALEEAISVTTSTWPADELVARLLEAGVPAARVLGAREQLAEPFFWERQLFRRTRIPGMGDQVLYGSPWRLEGTPSLEADRGPFLGEHTHDVLTSVAGLSVAEVDRLTEVGVLS